MQARRGHDTILPWCLDMTIITTATRAKYYCDDTETIGYSCLQEMHKHSLVIVEVLIKERPHQV